MIYLIDFENVHEEGFSALGRLGDKDAVYCFFTRNVAKISMSALAGMRSGQLHFIEAESGKQSLDLALVSYLGYLIGTRPQELYYEIVSNDNGFSKVAEFWNKRGGGLRVRIRKTNEVKPKAETVKPQAANTVRRTPVQPAQTAQKSAEQLLPEAETGSVDVPAAPAEASVQPAAVDQTAAAAQPAVVIQPAAEPTQETTNQSAPRQKQQRQRGQRQRSQRQRGGRQEQARAEDANIEQLKSETHEPAETEAETAKESAAPENTKTSAPVQPKPEKKQVPETKPASETKPVPESKPSEGETGSVLRTAGITAEAEEYIRAQAEKYREDKNMKQLVYRAVVKKFGQKNGTQIYNNAKKLLLK